MSPNWKSTLWSRCGYVIMCNNLVRWLKENYGRFKNGFGVLSIGHLCLINIAYPIRIWWCKSFAFESGKKNKRLHDCQKYLEITYPVLLSGCTTCKETSLSKLNILPEVLMITSGSRHSLRKEWYYWRIQTCDKPDSFRNFDLIFAYFEKLL